MPSGSPGEAPSAASPSVTSTKMQPFSNYWHSCTIAPCFVRLAFMHVDSLARIFIQSPRVLTSIILVRVVYHATHFGTTLARFVAS
eukprot:1352266-Pyramimonas_sp.AAC.1